MNARVTLFDTDLAGNFPVLLPESGQVICSTQELNLTPGRYYLNVKFFSNESVEDYMTQVAYFDICESDYFGTGKVFDSRLMKVLFKHSWKATKIILENE